MSKKKKDKYSDVNVGVDMTRAVTFWLFVYTFISYIAGFVFLILILNKVILMHWAWLFIFFALPTVAFVMFYLIWSIVENKKNK